MNFKRLFVFLLLLLVATEGFATRVMFINQTDTTVRFGVATTGQGSRQNQGFQYQVTAGSYKRLPQQIGVQYGRTGVQAGFIVNNKRIMCPVSSNYRAVKFVAQGSNSQYSCATKGW
jgi:hypothetical protein